VRLAADSLTAQAPLSVTQKVASVARLIKHQCCLLAPRQRRQNAGASVLGVSLNQGQAPRRPECTLSLPHPGPPSVRPLRSAQKFHGFSRSFCVTTSLWLRVQPFIKHVVSCIVQGLVPAMGENTIFPSELLCIFAPFFALSESEGSKSCSTSDYTVSKQAAVDDKCSLACKQVAGSQGSTKGLSTQTVRLHRQ
jgi:hypothetical protein